MNELIEQTFLREKHTDRAHFYKTVYDLIVSLLKGSSTKQFEEFFDYCKEMSKLLSHPKNSIEGVKGVGFKPGDENNEDKLNQISQYIYS